MAKRKKPTPPGHTLRELLHQAKRSQADLARSAKWSYKHVSELVNGKVALTPDTALILEGETGLPARQWLELEADYQLERRKRSVDYSPRSLSSWS